MTPEHDDEVTALRPTLGEAPGAVKESRFDPRSASPFVEKSLSEHTRRAYHLALTEFFRHAGMKHPSAVTPADVINWRDGLVRNKRKAATICFKLSVVRSFFEHLRASGLILLNPTSTKSVASPAPPRGQPAGHSRRARRPGKAR